LFIYFIINISFLAEKQAYPTVSLVRLTSKPSIAFQSSQCYTFSHAFHQSCIVHSRKFSIPEMTSSPGSLSLASYYPVETLYIQFHVVSVADSIAHSVFLWFLHFVF